MARKITRKSKPEIRWDSPSGGIVPEIDFDDPCRARILSICGKESAIDALRDYTGRFVLEQQLADNEPTSADYNQTLADLEAATSNLIDRLDMLRGHEIESLIDNAWYQATKQLPDWNMLESEVMKFRKYVWVAQRVLADSQNQKGRKNTSEPIRTLMRNCADVLESCGVAVSHCRNGQLIELVEVCLESAGVRRYANSLHHYLPKKVAKK